MMANCCCCQDKENKKVVMEEMKVDSSDILAIEGKIRGCKTRIILVYTDSTKEKHGKDYEKKAGRFRTR